MSENTEINCDFATQLYEQWMRRETWCSVTGVIPNIQRRHYPYKWFDKVQLCAQEAGAYSVSSGIRAVYFPRTRRMFPDLKNRSILAGTF